MNAAIKELVKSLENLHSDIKAVKESDKEEIKTIADALNSIDTGNDIDQKQLVIKLVELSRKVIDVRIKAIESGNSILANLTVPPYDLFLPFKSFAGPKIVEEPPIAVINRLINDIKYTANAKIENEWKEESD